MFGTSLVLLCACKVDKDSADMLKTNFNKTDEESNFNYNRK